MATVRVSRVILLALILTSCQNPPSDVIRYADATEVHGSPPARSHIQRDSIPWTTTNRYPEWFRKAYRYKELVGWVSNWQDVKARDWKGVPNRDIRMGYLQIDSGTTYPFHAHPAPELYYVIRGTAQWTVGNETFSATPGTAIYARPNTRHQMINTGDGTLELLYVWYAPGGNREVLEIPSAMLDGWDRQPAGGK
ncbi:MAG: hypothetical protein NVS9B3_13650 [Gemmatimonadaceae bacterium]